MFLEEKSRIEAKEHSPGAKKTTTTEDNVTTDSWDSSHFKRSRSSMKYGHKEAVGTMGAAITPQTTSHIPISYWLNIYPLGNIREQVTSNSQKSRIHFSNQFQREDWRRKSDEADFNRVLPYRILAPILRWIAEIASTITTLQRISG